MLMGLMQLRPFCVNGACCGDAFAFSAASTTASVVRLAPVAGAFVACQCRLASASTCLESFGASFGVLGLGFIRKQWRLVVKLFFS